MASSYQVLKQMNSPFAAAFIDAGWVEATPPPLDMPDVSRETYEFNGSADTLVDSPFDIGDRLICDMAPFMRYKKDAKQHFRRPVYVYGFIEDGGRATHIVVVLSSTQFDAGKKRAQLIFDRPEKFSALSSDLPFRLRTNRLFCLELSDALIRNTVKVGDVPEQFWPDILLKRADTILFADDANMVGFPQKRDGLIYHGPVFDSITGWDVRSGLAFPDVGAAETGVMVKPKTWGSISQDEINRIAAWARHRCEQNVKYPWPGRWGRWPEYHAV